MDEQSQKSAEPAGRSESAATGTPGPVGTSELAGTRGLAGSTVLVTRSPDRAGAFLRAFRAAGAVPYLLPLIDFEAVDFPVQALQAGEYDWLVVSSITTVRALKAQAQRDGYSWPQLIPAKTRIATIGPSSRRVLEREGLRVELAPQEQQSAEGLIALLPDLSGTRVYLPQSDLATPQLAEALRSAGADVDVAVAYRTVDYPAAEASRLSASLAAAEAQPNPVPAAELESESAATTEGAAPEAARQLSIGQARRLIDQGGLDAVLAASPSAARRIAQTLAPLRATKFLAIGEPTARQAAQDGLAVAAVAPEPTPAGVVAALSHALHHSFSSGTLSPEREGSTHEH